MVGFISSQSVLFWDPISVEGSVTPLQIVFKSIHGVHFVWRCFKRGGLYSNPENTLNLIAGHGLNFAAGNSRFVKGAARCLLVARCFFDLLEEKKRVEESFNRCKHAFQGSYIYPVRVDVPVKGGCLAPHQWIYIQSLYETKKQHLYAILETSIELVQRVFFLSMRLLDLMEAFSTEEHVTNRSVNEIFVNMKQGVDEFVKSRSHLMEELEVNEAVIQSLLNRINPNLSTTGLFANIDRSFEILEKRAKEWGMLSNMVSTLFQKIFIESTGSLIHCS